MKILSADQVYQADKSTINQEGISSDELMERAAKQVFDWIHGRLQGSPVNIYLLCGIGNNGGDGLVLGRYLWEHGYHIDIFIVNYSEHRSDDFLTNLKRLKERKIWPQYLDENTPLPEFQNADVIVDAIFGIGLNRPAAPWLGQLIQAINTSERFVLSIDVPSGMFVDSPLENGQAVVHASHVLTFQVPKLAFFLPESGKYIDNWEVVDIGLDPDFLERAETNFVLTELHEARSWCRPRKRFAHKGDFGHALIIGGSYGKIGAVILSARAALQSGCGLLTAYLPKCGYLPLQTAVPEAMVITDPSEKEITSVATDWTPDAVGMGIGMGRSGASVKALSAFLKNYNGPLVLDADALNILSENQELLKAVSPGTIFTPHPGELKRLLGPWKNDFEKLEKAQQFAERHKCVLVIKGAYTLILHEGKGYINPTGNPGMATAGSGDVLTGILTSLIAQKYDPLTAARFGVYLHGLAGDIAAEQLGYEALTASAITERLAMAYQFLWQKSNDNGKKEETSSPGE